MASAAWSSGAYDAEVIAVSVTNPKTGQVEEFRRDEHMRPDTTLDRLRKLKPHFRADGVVTAGNASGIGDGAAALVIASEDFARSKELSPLGRLVSWGVAGVDPSVMGIGPVPASRMALDAAGLRLADMDLIEVNEAFAPQTCAVERELAIPREKLNVHGGAIALSHPLAASGARITTHLLHALRAAGKRYGLGAACIGGGQGIAMIVEAVQ
jgi:acetyl-CoA acetyltransferase family protein